MSKIAGLGITSFGDYQYTEVGDYEGDLSDYLNEANTGDIGDQYTEECPAEEFTRAIYGPPVPGTSHVIRTWQPGNKRPHWPGEAEDEGGTYGGSWH
jgi:hypothetical protein